MKLITPNYKEYYDIQKRVSECHGWCEITDLGGDHELGIYMATFADDYRIIFEWNELDNDIRLMLTLDQEVTFLECTNEENDNTMYEIMVFFNIFLENTAIKSFSAFHECMTGEKL